MTELQEYMTTGMLGSYQPERAVFQQAETGVRTNFRDTVHREFEGHEIHELRMLIGGKSFHISSVFPSNPTATPPDMAAAISGVRSRHLMPTRSL